MPVGRVHHHDVDARPNERLGAIHQIGTGTNRGGHSQPAVLVFVGVGVLAALENVLHRDEAAQFAVFIEHGKLLDAVLAESFFRFVQGGAHRGGDEPFLRHRFGDRPIQIPLELQIAVGDDPHQSTVFVDDRHTGDFEARHERTGLADRAIGSERDRVENHPTFRSLHPVDLRRLLVDGHVLVDDADPAGARHRNRHFRFGHRVHRRRHHRRVERDAPGKRAPDVHVGGMHGGVSRREDDIVESEARTGSYCSHHVVLIRKNPPCMVPGGLFEVELVSPWQKVPWP